MPRQSLKASPAGIEQATKALTGKAWTQEKLAEELDLRTRWSVANFFGGKRVKRQTFVEICNKLELDWEEIVYLPKDTEPEPADQDRSIIDALVQKVRHHCHNKIQQLYGKMHLFDISQPVNVDNLYVEVNILEQISGQQWIEISDLLQDLNSAADDFDRLGVGKIRQQRVPGLEVATTHSKLMVLGKPGSGKTTFLQHLAIQCNKGNFKAERVPIFIRLKNFAKYAKDEGDFRLLNYISREFRSCGISDQDVTEAILNQGRGLILLDGLDEVPDEDENEIIEQIRQFSEDYYENQLVITCRIAASKYRFPAFTNVEVADFNKQQIKSFAERWFVAFAKNDQEKGKLLAKQFIEKLNRSESKQIKELAGTPILLHITCLVFSARAEFLSKRSRLYEQGLDILLVGWDESRGIQRDEVSRSLTLPRKQQLLYQLAAITFDQGDYFFEKHIIQQLIADYLSTLPNSKIDSAQLQLNSQIMLKGIEAQHGLLVERARGIYSFSHLTFQEYCTARYFVESSDLQALENLSSHITEKRWYEVFLLTAEILPSADSLLQLMKRRTDELVAGDEKLQKFLMWVSQKSLLVDVSYKLAAVRAFYFALNLTLDLDLALALDSCLERALVCVLDLDLTLDLDLALVRVCVRVCVLALTPAFVSILVPAVDSALNRALESELRQALQKLKEQLPDLYLYSDKEIFQQWWKANSQAWTRQLREIMILHRNIGHDWQFSHQQKKTLRQYHDANLLLVNCLNSTFYVTPAVREEIEETLLLPTAETKKRLSCQDK